MVTNVMGVPNRKHSQAAFSQNGLEEEEKPRLLTGASPISFAAREISKESTLLGDRFLCRGGGLFIVAPSGHGKSVLTIQCAVLWSCGLPAFGIRPAQPLQCLVVQAEDDEGDVTEMCRSSINGLNLTEEQKKVVGQHAHIEFVNDLTGTRFIKALKGFLEQRSVDLVFINPYTAYLGGDIKDDRENTRFLRNELNPLLTAHKSGAVIIHHTPKTQFNGTDNFTPSDWAYRGAGAAVLTNWARAYIAIDPCKDAHGIYRFIAAKRGKRIGWESPERYFAHSAASGQLLWLPATQEQLALAKKAADVKPDDLLPLITALDPISREAIRQLAKERLRIGKDKADDYLKLLIERGEVHKWSLPREPGGARSGVGFAQRSQPADDVS